MDIEISNERVGDFAQIHNVTELAFRDAPHTDHTEQFIVEALRQAAALTISKVAQSDGVVVGHIAISPVVISDEAVGWFGLGPISVLPEFQRQGIGSKLVKSALFDLESRGAAGCVVLGDPGYYGRFGFRVVEGLVFPGVPIEYFQAKTFHGGCPKGEVVYHEAFSAQG